MSECGCDLWRREGKKEGVGGEGGRNSHNVQWAFQLSHRNSATLKTISSSVLGSLPSSYKLYVSPTLNDSVVTGTQISLI